jgi:hypothetical protein
MISRFEVKINRCAERYRAARQALLSLDPHGDYMSRFLELKAEHIKGPRRDDDVVDRVPEGHREISWIWLVRQQSTDGTMDDELVTDSESYIVLCSLPLSTAIHLGLQVEWAKSRARVARWTEEVQLTVEEMCRVLSYLQWKSEWWLAQRSSRSGITEELGEGLSAYAMKQHDMLQRMACRFAAQWWPVLSANNLDMKWPEHFIPNASVQSPVPPIVLDPSDIDFTDDFD